MGAFFLLTSLQQFRDGLVFKAHRLCPPLGRIPAANYRDMIIIGKAREQDTLMLAKLVNKKKAPTRAPPPPPPRERVLY